MAGDLQQTDQTRLNEALEVTSTLWRLQSTLHADTGAGENDSDSDNGAKNNQVLEVTKIRDQRSLRGKKACFKLDNEYSRILKTLGPMSTTPLSRDLGWLA